METAIADQMTKGKFGIKNESVSRFFKVGLLICLALFLPVSAQLKKDFAELKQAQVEFDNGSYDKAIELTETGIERAKKSGKNLLFSQGPDILISSQIWLKRYDEAADNLNKALREQTENSSDEYQKVLIYLRFAWLYRTQREFAEAFDYSKKAVEILPENRSILAEHYLVIGRILFTSGYDISAIIWLEKAEKILELEKENSAKIDTYRILSLAWSSKLNYQKALKYAEKCVFSAEKSKFKYKHRQALLDLATALSASGQKQKAILTLEKGLKLSEEQGDSYQAGKFLTSLLLHSLDNGNVSFASSYLKKLEKLDGDGQFSFEVKLGKGVIFAFQNQYDISEKLFTELEKSENTSDFILLYWKITVAEKKQDWQQVINLNQDLLKMTIDQGFREDLPRIYLNFAKAYFKLNQIQNSLENVEKSIGYIEEIRGSDNQNLSLGILETYHDAYRLLAQINFDKPQNAFELADLLKARTLKDRINNAALKVKNNFSPAVRQKLEKLSLQYINDQSVADEIEKNEKLISSVIPELSLDKPDLAEMEKISGLNDTAIISYFFISDKKLSAFVWEKDKPLKIVYLPVSEDEAEYFAKTTHQKIKNFIFFKKDGKDLYDKLLKPLNLSAKHLVIIPDKSLWKIPFQALSPEGEKYLIEDNLISYAPSVSILLKQLKTPKQNRQTLQAFANPSYENRFLQYVNAEATSVAEIYNAKSKLNATVADFKRIADKADILHFSMHAQVDNEQPLDSFLAFKKIGEDDGRLTVEEILNINLKKGSLAFLASCDTNNVLNGEGLVSLAWGMMGSGATTVISAQWEANDKSTEIFTKTFYQYYKQGSSAAEATQKAAMEMIGNKSNNMHEPYYWAEFALNGDFR